MSRELQIHIKDGKCKVIEGAAKRVFWSTEEAVGLALLKLNPTLQATISVPWQDFLAARGVAFAAAGDKSLNLIVYTNQKRTIQFRRGSGVGQELVIKLPPLLVATSFKDNHLVKTQLWVIKPGMENRLSTTSTDATLCPFPYGNVYSHGGVCWGTTLIRDLRQPGEVVDAFFNSGFNGDLYTASYLGIRDVQLPDLIARVGEDLPVPPATMYTKSVATMAQEINR